MVAPAIVAAGVSAVSSLLGGRKAKKEAARARAFEQQMIREQNAYNAPDAIRARAESAGFNPLLFVGPGVGLQTSLASYGDTSAMGNAIANAGLAVADGISEYGKQQAYESALEKQNSDLRKALEKNTLRPEVAGVFGTAQPVTVPDVPLEMDAVLFSTGGGVYDITSGDTSTTEKVPVAPVVEPTPLMQTYEYDGETLTAPSFIDIDELVSGAAAMAAIAYKKATKARVTDHIDMVGRMLREKSKNENMVKTIREQGRNEPLGAGASRMPSKTPWWLTR